MRVIRLIVLVVAVLLPAESILAQLYGPQIPDTLSIQGYLTDPGGTPITQEVNITTTFYKGGVAGYSQVHSNVSVVNGLFNILVGPLDTVAFNQPIEVGIQVGADPEISPRTPLVAAPFALAMRGMYALPAQDVSFTGLNIIGGWSENYVAPGVVGATIAGGGGIRGSTSEPDSVTGDMGTVGGGLGNAAGWNATVGGGRLNRATDHAATVGGGLENTAIGQLSTIGGGSNNLITQVGGTVGGGQLNKAGQNATVGGGSSNEATGSHSTIPGGSSNEALNSYSFAAGRAAKAIHTGSFVWADAVNTNPPTPWPSTGDNQFLIKAHGGVGIGLNAPEEQLHVLDPSGSTGVKLGGDGTNGPHGIIFDDDTVDAGVQLFWRTAANQLILERTSQGTSTNGTDAFLYDRDDERFLFSGSRSATATFTGHLVGFDNTAGGSADGIAIRLGASNAGGGNNFISFFDGDGDPYGRIEGNGSNGVVYETTGGDYAEYLPRLDPTESIEAGDVVAVVNGSLTRATGSGHRVMVISDRPAVLGNMPVESKEHLFERAAFVGKVPVKVVGPVASGDYLLPSGNDDGTAIARNATELRPADLDRIVGVAWQSSNEPQPKKVIAEVGLDRGRAARLAFDKEITRLWAVIEMQQRRLDILEAGGNPGSPISSLQRRGL